MAKTNKSNKRFRILSNSTAHRTQRALVAEASERGWIIETAPYEYIRSLSPETFPYDAVVSLLNADFVRRILLPLIGNRPHVTMHSDVATQFDIPSVVMNHAAAGRMVAQHFLSLNFEHFAAIGEASATFSRRVSGLTEAIREAGLPPPRIVPISGFELQDYKKSISLIGSALERLPRPLAIMSQNDRVAVRVMHTCWHKGISIPSQVGICGFDNDQTARDLAPVPLSSVDTNPELQVQKVMEIVADLLDNKPLIGRHVIIEPTTLVVRRSSGIVASRNIIQAKALAYIHQHAWATDLSIPEIAEELGVSETTLYVTFRNELSITPLKYITNLRIEKAQRLINETNQKLSDIRPHCGFASDYQMYQAFKRETGKPPGAFR